jgi:peptidoglycan hydrolase-like protein with peptidoglycan-binding domain
LANLRYGSKGDLVRSLQRALMARGHDTGGADGDFGRLTNQAVLDFQTAVFGPSQVVLTVPLLAPTGLHRLSTGPGPAILRFARR